MFTLTLILLNFTLARWWTDGLPCRKRDKKGPFIAVLICDAGIHSDLKIDQNPVGPKYKAIRPKCNEISLYIVALLFSYCICINVMYYGYCVYIDAQFMYTLYIVMPLHCCKSYNTKLHSYFLPRWFVFPFEGPYHLHVLTVLYQVWRQNLMFLFFNIFQKMFVCIELWVPWKRHKWSVSRRRVRISDVFGINWSCSPFARARRRWAVCYPVGSQVKPDISRHAGPIETE